jgi:hypothetical protein
VRYRPSPFPELNQIAAARLDNTCYQGGETNQNGAC